MDRARCRAHHYSDSRGGAADKNIDELLEDFNGSFHRVRHSGIDEEPFDVIAGFEVLAQTKAAGGVARVASSD